MSRINKLRKQKIFKYIFELFSQKKAFNLSKCKKRIDIGDEFEFIDRENLSTIFDNPVIKYQLEMKPLIKPQFILDQNKFLKSIMLR
jgi:hypothetical protein